MSEHLFRISSCEQITEWITPQDERLVRVTGLTPPVDARTLREEWRLKKAEIPELLFAVKRLIVPTPLEDKVFASFDTSTWGDDASGTIGFTFANYEDWRQCLPANEQTVAFDRNGARGNAAIAVCGQTAGLAVMAMEFVAEEELDFAIQPIRQDKLEMILN